MPFCINCGQELPNDAKFCSNCGNSINEHSSIMRRTVYEGEMHKCPNCGGYLNAFETKCTECGYEVRGTQTTSCVHELSIKLQKTEQIAKKIELISTFYIPNTKEDIYEFFILAYSNISAGVYEIDAWIAKLEQAYLKAKLSFGKDDEFLYIQELYNNLQNTSKKTKTIKSKVFKPLIIMIAGFLFALICIIILYATNDEFFLIFAVVGAVPMFAGMIMFFIVEFKSILKK